MSRDLIAEYIHAVHAIENSRDDIAIALATELRSILPQTSEIELMRKLLSLRLSLKRSSGFVETEELVSSKHVKHPLLKAEAAFVRGLIHFHREQFDQGANEFQIAATLYPLETHANKKLLAEYNQFVGLLNANKLDHNLEDAHITYLERAARAENNSKVLSLLLRHKSYMLEQRGQLHGALRSAIDAINLLLKTGPTSDLQLLGFHVAHIYIQLNEHNLARETYETILGPFDQRVVFAKDLVRAFLDQTPIPNPKDYLGVSPNWKEKWETWTKNSRPEVSKSSSQYIWYRSRGEIHSTSGSTILLRKDSVEERLLNLLLQGKKNRDELCELLWPESVDSETLWNRLKMALKRIKQKSPGLVVFKNGMYQIDLLTSIDQEKVS